MIETTTQSTNPRHEVTRPGLHQKICQENAKEPNQPARCLLGSTRLGKAAPMEPSLLDDMPCRSGVLDDRREVEFCTFGTWTKYVCMIY